jgi:heat-inducible transcriptional repressor
MLIKPEFHDAMKVSTVVQFLEDKEQFLINLDEMGISDDIKIFIGHENMLEAIQSCTLIAVSYRFSDDLNGIIGILGPMRMQYARNIAALQAIKDDITR